MLNQEWFRKFPSKLDRTLRFPRLIKFGILLLFERFAVFWFILLLWLLLPNIFLLIPISFALVLVYELFTLRDWYIEKILPRHKENIDDIKHLYEESEKYSANELVEAIEQAVEKSSWGIVRLVYLGFPSLGWEIIFRFLYPLLVKTDEIPYQHLLIGFGNKVTEADEFLWKVAQEKDSKKQNTLLKEYLDEYACGPGDFDLSLPTLREQPKAIEKLLQMYSQAPSPKTALERSKTVREESTEEVLSNLRIPKGVFIKFLKLVQENVALREDRRFYELKSDFYIRRMILRLSKQIKINENEVFNTSWRTIKNYAKNRGN